MTGTVRAGRGTVGKAASPPVSDSRTALVNSSAKSGTPSVRLAISCPNLGWQQTVTGNVFDQRLGAAPVETPQRKCRDIRLTDPDRLELWAKGRQHQYRPVPQLPDYAIQQLARTRVNPVEVLENHQHWPLAGKALHQAKQRLKCFLFSAFRAAVERRREVRCWQRAQLGDKRQIFR